MTGSGTPARDPGGRPSIPRARTATAPAAPAARRGWRERGWDIPWLGGRSTAPWVVLATVVILLVAVAGQLYAMQRPDRLGWSPKTITATSDDAVVFTFEVRKAPGAVAACDIAAADPQGGVGALRDIQIPARADGADTTELTVTVPTTRRAETAVLQGCRIVRPG